MESCHFCWPITARKQHLGDRTHRGTFSILIFHFRSAPAATYNSCHERMLNGIKIQHHVRIFLYLVLEVLTSNRASLALLNMHWTQDSIFMVFHGIRTQNTFVYLNCSAIRDPALAVDGIRSVHWSRGGHSVSVLSTVRHGSKPGATPPSSRLCPPAASGHRGH